MVHWWDDLTFLHWRYPTDAVQKLLPPGLEVEPFDGSAWVGLVPFFLRVGVPAIPPVPWLSQFAETNVWTYVRSADGEPGSGFFSLDAARLGAVLVARGTYRLPYFWSWMRMERHGDRIGYECRRRWPRPSGARSKAVIEIGEPYSAHELSELDHYLTARWGAVQRPSLGNPHARAFHDPWPLRRASVAHLDDDLVAAAGLPGPTSDPLVHFSPSVQVRIGWPQPIGGHR